jgi:hypothetical protein
MTPEGEAFLIAAGRPRQMTRIAVLFGVLLGLDAATTFIALTYFGAVELNPLGPLLGILGKAVAVAIILGLVRLADPAWRVRVAAPGTLALLLPIMWNVSQMTGMLRS